MPDMSISEAKPRLVCRRISGYIPGKIVFFLLQVFPTRLRYPSHVSCTTMKGIDQIQ